MRRFLTPRVIAGVVIVLVVAITLGAVYFTILAPQLRVRRKLQKDLETAENNFVQVKGDFGQNPDPQAELALLTREVAALEEAVASLDKIAKARLPVHLFPEDLETPDTQQLLRRYKDHLEETSEDIEVRVDDAYREKRIPVDKEVEFEYKLRQGPRTPREDVDKFAMEKMVELRVMEDIAMLLLDADIFALRKMKRVSHERSGELRIVTMEVHAELSTESLVRLAYLMRERDAYYFFRELLIAPSNKSRGSRYFDANESTFDDVDEYLMKAEIATLRIQPVSDAPVDRRAQARRSIEKNAKQAAAASSSPWLSLMSDLSDPDADKSQFGEEKPWWKFW